MDVNKQLQAFFAGENYEAQNCFGVHRCDEGYLFRTWAPSATRVMLTGDFNNWNDDVVLKKTDVRGVWETVLPFDRAVEGTRYKYRIYGCGQVHYKSDPYSTAQALEPDNASILTEHGEYPWKDSGWLKFRRAYQKDIESRPLNIYEVHLGTWKKKSRGDYLNYRDYARELAPYVKQMGYTHVCLMPITEYSNEASTGYEPTAFFAPTARYGSAEDFKAFVDKMHEAGVSVMLGWHVSAFPKERYSLLEFDGGNLYESGEPKNSGGFEKCFDVSRKEIQSFLISNAKYWISEYHIDALCISSVEDFLTSSEDIAQAEAFLKKTVSVLKRNFPDVLIALRGTDEDPKSFGADIAFNSNWADKMLEYASISYESRPDFHEKIVEDINTVSSGRTVFPVSYRNMCYGKRSCIEKMFGDYWQKFAGGRTMVGLMMTMHGKKLLFMGSEFAQFDEWAFDRETEWFLLEYESHAKFQRYVAELNNFYLSHSALWQKDKGEEGFAWIDRNNSEQSVIIFRRSSHSEELTVVVNLTPTVYEDFVVGSHGEGVYEEIFNSDNTRFYGSGVINTQPLRTVKKSAHGYKNSFRLRVPPLGITILSFKGKGRSK